MTSLRPVGQRGGNISPLMLTNSKRCLAPWRCHLSCAGRQASRGFRTRAAEDRRAVSFIDTAKLSEDGKVQQLAADPNGLENNNNSMAVAEAVGTTVSGTHTAETDALEEPRTLKAASSVLLEGDSSSIFQGDASKWVQCQQCQP